MHFEQRVNKTVWSVAGVITDLCLITLFVWQLQKDILVSTMILGNIFNVACG